MDKSLMNALYRVGLPCGKIVKLDEKNPRDKIYIDMDRHVGLPFGGCHDLCPDGKDVHDCAESKRFYIATSSEEAWIKYIAEKQREAKQNG